MRTWAAQLGVQSPVGSARSPAASPAHASSSAALEDGRLRCDVVTALLTQWPAKLVRVVCDSHDRVNPAGARVLTWQQVVAWYTAVHETAGTTLRTPFRHVVHGEVDAAFTDHFAGSDAVRRCGGLTIDDVLAWLPSSPLNERVEKATRAKPSTRRRLCRVVASPPASPPRTAASPSRAAGSPHAATSPLRAFAGHAAVPNWCRAGPAQVPMVTRWRLGGLRLAPLQAAPVLRLTIEAPADAQVAAALPDARYAGTEGRVHCLELPAPLALAERRVRNALPTAALVSAVPDAAVQQDAAAEAVGRSGLMDDILAVLPVRGAAAESERLQVVARTAAALRSRRRAPANPLSSIELLVLWLRTRGAVCGDALLTSVVQAGGCAEGAEPVPKPRCFEACLAAATLRSSPSGDCWTAASLTTAEAAALQTADVVYPSSAVTATLSRSAAVAAARPPVRRTRFHLRYGRSTPHAEGVVGLGPRERLRDALQLTLQESCGRVTVSTVGQRGVGEGVEAGMLVEAVRGVVPRDAADFDRLTDTDGTAIFSLDRAPPAEARPEEGSAAADRRWTAAAQRCHVVVRFTDVRFAVPVSSVTSSREERELLVCPLQPFRVASFRPDPLGPDHTAVLHLQGLPPPDPVVLGSYSRSVAELAWRAERCLGAVVQHARSALVQSELSSSELARVALRQWRDAGCPLWGVGLALSLARVAKDAQGAADALAVAAAGGRQVRWHEGRATVLPRLPSPPTSSPIEGYSPPSAPATQALKGAWREAVLLAVDGLRTSSVSSAMRAAAAERDGGVATVTLQVPCQPAEAAA